MPVPAWTTTTRPLRGWRLVALGGLLALSVTACGSGGGGSAAGAAPAGAVPDTTALLAGVGKDAALAATLPPAITQAGTLRIGSYLQSAPNNFYATDGTTPIGYDVDLAKATAAKLGLRVTYQDMPFGSLITSLQSGRVDMTMAAMNDTAERQKQIDFVDYFRSGITIMVQKGNPAGVTGPDALCGKAVAVVQGTSQQEFATAQSASCTQGGKPPVAVTATDSDTQNQNQLRTARVAAVVNDLPSAVYIARTAGDGSFFEIVPGEPINGGPYGIGVNKADKPLTTALSGALSALVADGTYRKILDAWGVSQGAVARVGINGAS